MFVLVLLLWQGAVSILGVREFLLPSPLAVLRAMAGHDIPWAFHIWTTAVEILGAFVLAVAAGLACTGCVPGAG